MEMGILEGLLLVSLSLGLAFLLIWLTNRVGGRVGDSIQDLQSGRPDKAVFLFQGGILLDANSAGQGMLISPGENKADWRHLAKLLTPQFPDFPVTQGAKEDHDARTFLESDVSGSDFVLLEQWNDMARVTVQQQPQPNASTTPVDPISNSALAVSEAPYPVWQSTQNGQVEWANNAYLKLAKDLGLECSEETIPHIFEQSALAKVDQQIRTSVSDASRTRNYWFDVTTPETRGVHSHFATDANAVVNAGIAQRNFVQTLTKTFAQLSIGLAIFDRNRQLALFNPALIDLTALPADFLSSRPNLLAFFDRMRENRMMPEPRNYSSWREQIAELVVAASDDRYTETWTLPSGVTYRVLGRPHPDGAIAFLFEDISAEVSLTRRFRAEMELGKSTLDSLIESVVVFAATGKLNFCNLAYRKLWSTEPESGITEYSFQDGIREWRTQTEKSDVCERLRHHILDINPRENWSASLTHQSGPSLTMRVVSLSGGFTSIVFESADVVVKPDISAEILAG